MKILIDGDSCNTIKNIVKDAKAKNQEVHIYCDTRHLITNKYATVHIVDAGPDAVDFAIANATEKGDTVITNDGGLAAMVMAKGGRAVHFNGKRYSEQDIQDALTFRYLRNKKFKHQQTKNMSSKHKSRKHKTIYVTECWA